MRPIHVLIATPRGENGTGGIDRMTDVVRHYLRDHPDANFKVRFVVTRGPGRLVFWPFYLFRSLVTLLLLRVRNQVDVVHINISQRGSAIRKVTLAYAARVLGVPYILHLHGSEFRQYWESTSPSFSIRLQRAFSNSAMTLVLGSAWSTYIRRKIPQGRIEILPNATWAPLHGRDHTPHGEAPRILFLGRIGARKGVPELIKALGLLDRSLAWRATIAGDGDVEGARAQVVAEDIGDRTSVTGWAGPDEVNRLLAGSDILVLPSHDENLPLSVIEGMGFGLAVVTTPVGAVPDIIIDGETGLLTPPGDPTSLAMALTRVVSDASLRARLGAAARDFHAVKLNVETYIDQLKRFWRASINVGT
jgi:glycosyltransferase involved in cell wall biosynthesis